MKRERFGGRVIARVNITCRSREQARIIKHLVAELVQVSGRRLQPIDVRVLVADCGGRTHRFLCDLLATGTALAAERIASSATS